MTILLAALLAQTVPAADTASSSASVCASSLLVQTGDPCPFLLFFDSGKAEISRDANGTLGQAVAAWRNGRFSRVSVVGHSDRSGPSAGNHRVSRARAEAVRQALLIEGVPEAAIRFEAQGEQQPIIATADGVREPQNRRVEVRLQR